MGTKIITNLQRADWQEMVEDAKSKLGCNKSSKIDEPLVDIILKSIDRPEIIDFDLKRNADYLSDINTFSDAEIEYAADQCLIQIGLFPNRLQQIACPVFLIIYSGRLFYKTLGEKDNDHQTKHFIQLSKHFILAMDILLTLREHFFQEPLHPEIFQQLIDCTTSQYAFKQLNS